MEGIGWKLFREPRSWTSVDDDIVPLLQHSDCEGVLTPEECRHAAPRLRQLVAKWHDGDHDKYHALLLADAMQEYYVLGEELKFK